MKGALKQLHGKKLHFNQWKGYKVKYNKARISIETGKDSGGFLSM